MTHLNEWLILNSEKHTTSCQEHLKQTHSKYNNQPNKNKTTNKTPNMYWQIKEVNNKILRDAVTSPYPNVEKKIKKRIKYIKNGWMVEWVLWGRGCLDNINTK